MSFRFLVVGYTSRPDENARNPNKAKEQANTVSEHFTAGYCREFLGRNLWVEVYDVNSHGVLGERRAGPYDPEKTVIGWTLPELETPVAQGG